MNLLSEEAKKLLGVPYKYGAKSEEAPKFFDCSSLTQYLYKKIGVELPRSSILQAVAGKEIFYPQEKLEVGDLIFFRGQRGHYNDELFPNHPPVYIGHVAVYIGDEKIIHATGSAGKVVEENLKEFIKRPNCSIVMVKRVLV
jgi:cell wall-associated NlpC family hydrolase